MNDFREFSKAYNNYLMHAGTNNGVNIVRLSSLLKSYKKSCPPEKHPKIDQLSRIVIQQAQNGNIQQAREAGQELNNITPGSPSSMLFQAIINELTKPQPTYRMADGVPRPITGKRLSHSNDFREFSEEYNDYLMHYGVKGMKWHDHVYKHHTVVPGARQIGGNKKKDVNGSDDLKRESQVRDLVNYNKENNRQSDGYMDATSYRYAARDTRDYGYAQEPSYSNTRRVSDEQAREEAAQRLEELAEKRSRATNHLNSYYYRSRGKKNRH